MVKKVRVKSKAKAKTKAFKNTNFLLIFLPILTFLLAIIFTGTLWYPGPQELATIKQKELAKQQINQIIINNQNFNCANNPYQQAPVANAKEVTVNGFADRAVVRGCWGKDFMLYKNKVGNWNISEVDLILDFEHNPKWAYKCKIQDIVKLSNTTLPENFSIDDFNYQECSDILNR